MKTIKVTDEMYSFLTDLSKELNTQSHRGTAMPYFFQIQTKEQVSASDGDGTEAWHYDGSLIETEEEIREVILEWKEWDNINSGEADIIYSKLTDYEKEEILKEAGWCKIWYDSKDHLENAFFTEKACKQHIKCNSHYYNKPVDYLSFASRNNEMEMVMKFLCELTGGKLHI